MLASLRTHRLAFAGVVLIALSIGVGLALLGEAVDRYLRAAVTESRRSTAVRAAVLAPALVEIMYCIGAQDELVAVGRWCQYPPEASMLPNVGSLNTVNQEELIRLQVNTLLVQDSSESLRRFAEHNRIRLFDLQVKSLNDLYESIRLMGEICKKPDEAAACLRTLKSELDALRQVHAASPVRTLIAFGHSPGGLHSIVSCNGSTFLSSLLEIAGGENVVADVSAAWPQISVETIMQLAPEVILDISMTSKSSDLHDRLVRDWKDAMPDCPAVYNNRVYVIEPGSLLIPGPRVPESARQLKKLIHGDVHE